MLSAQEIFCATPAYLKGAVPPRKITPGQRTVVFRSDQAVKQFTNKPVFGAMDSGHAFIPLGVNRLRLPLNLFLFKPATKAIKCVKRRGIYPQGKFESRRGSSPLASVFPDSFGDCL